MDKIWHALNSDITWDSIKGLGGVFSAIGGFLVAVGVFLHKIRSYGRRISENEKDLEKLSENFNRRLYNADSQPIYVPVSACRVAREDRDKLRVKENAEIHEKLDLLINMHLKNAHIVEVVEDRREDERRKKERRQGGEIKIMCKDEEEDIDV
jgi:hypothetical protein